MYKTISMETSIHLQWKLMDSNDSRYWGLVPEEYIVGIVQYVIRKDRGIIRLN